MCPCVRHALTTLCVQERNSLSELLYTGALYGNLGPSERPLVHVRAGGKGHHAHSVVVAHLFTNVRLRCGATGAEFSCERIDTQPVDLGAVEEEDEGRCAVEARTRALKPR